MNPIRTLCAALLLLLIVSCSSPRSITTWSEKGTTKNYSKILVASIVYDSSLTTRRLMEIHSAEHLKELGYNAVSALETFGRRGLANFQQEETYVRLCNEGIDAVLTIALLDKEQFYLPENLHTYSALDYYKRIWNYKMQLSDSSILHAAFNTANKDVFWETIFFDLQTLSTVYVSQTKPFAANSVTKNIHQYSSLITSDMTKKKVLGQQYPSSNNLKAF